MDAELIRRIRSIYEQGLSGRRNVEMIASQWPDSHDRTMALLYEELEDAVAHAPATSLFSKSIDFEKWEQTPEFCVAYFNLLTIENFFSDSTWQEKKAIAFKAMKVYSKVEVQQLVKALA